MLSYKKKEELKKTLYILYCAILALAVSACSKEEQGDSNGLPYITFGVSGINIDTKALITNDDLTSNSHPNVYVYGVKNNTTNIFDGTEIYKENNSNNWNTDPKEQWERGQSYSFHGFTHSPQTPTNGASFSMESSGLEISVSQPDDYDEANMVDYLLSHAYKVADVSNYRTVMLYMQHAMSWIEIVVQKEMPEHTIALNSINLSNIFRSATMKCEFQGIANSGDKNVWAVQLSGTNNQTYTKTSFTPPGENHLGSMRILAIPQQLTNATTLAVNYTVTEPESGAKTYEQKFNLLDYTPYVWESGHKIIYTLTINTGVQLKGEICEWKDGGYTEGVIIPKN